MSIRDVDARRLYQRRYYERNRERIRSRNKGLTACSSCGLPGHNRRGCAGAPDVPTTGIAIKDQYECVHACSPFCPGCGTRLQAQGRISFSGALIDRDGWHDEQRPDNLSYQADCTDLDGVCPACGEYWPLHFCYGQDPECSLDGSSGKVKAGE